MTTIQLVITSLLKVSFQTFLSNLLQCFLSKYVWTSLHIQIAHSRATGANQSLSDSPSITHRHQFTLLCLLPCLNPFMALRCCEYESYSSLRTISKEEERAVTGSILTKWTRVSRHSGSDGSHFSTSKTHTQRSLLAAGSLVDSGCQGV